MADAESDALLVARLAAGDDHALAEAYDAHAPAVFRVALRMTGEASAAQDVVQTAWLRLVENAARIEQAQAVMGWLLVTVRRESWRVCKDSGRIAGEVPAEIVDAAPGPATLAVLSEENGVLWEHFKALTPRCQALLRVIAFSERPDYAAISESLGMPVGSIGPTRGRCLSKLRELLTNDPAWGAAQ